MMTPRQYEELISKHYSTNGYTVELTPVSGDYGVDLFAVKGKRKLAVQVKMYGHTTRKINRQTIMELHGAKDYFECTGAAIVTDGILLPDAVEVANKLGIEIVYIKADHTTSRPSKKNTQEITFDSIWQNYIMPLQGKTLLKSDGGTNTITKVDWGGIERITSNGNKGKIKMEIFKMSINKLLKTGYITREEINQNYPGRASSGIILILSQVPVFKMSKNPNGLTYSLK
ncbi:hypothetical protein GCM10023093_17790 [Nemorincola caseinilytica]|uniref:Restriction endonuclease type IV Mrr domain-containing protein n=1 Tax=Nemorincola caseinilytica TaxID=2054315 RepID=A0ABP8NGN4_9BACT